MKYLGLDVHLKSTVWCLLDEDGSIAEHGKADTTVAGLRDLLTKLKPRGELTAGQEVGSLCYFVSDIFCEKNVKLLTFNAYQLRMIASSRKKTDERDASPYNDREVRGMKTSSRRQANARLRKEIVTVSGSPLSETFE